VKRVHACLVFLAVLVSLLALCGCSTSNAQTAEPQATREPVAQGLELVEPSTPEDEAYLQAFEASGGPPGYPSGWTELSVDDIPEHLVPADTMGANLLAAAIRHVDSASGETSSGAPAYVKMLFEGGLFIQASADDSIRPNAIILTHHAQQMATEPGYSAAQTATVAGTVGLTTVGELPAEWFAAGWTAVREGAAVQWADSEWFYNVWMPHATDTQAVLTVARSIGE